MCGLPVVAVPVESSSVISSNSLRKSHGIILQTHTPIDLELALRQDLLDDLGVEDLVEVLLDQFKLLGRGHVRHVRGVLCNSLRVVVGRGVSQQKSRPKKCHGFNRDSWRGRGNFWRGGVLYQSRV